MSTIKGYFTSDGKDKYINVPIGADWIAIRNLTKIGTAVNATLCKTFWDSDMTGTYQYGIGEVRENTIDALIPGALAATTGVTPINTNDNPLSAVDATVTAVSADAIPVVTVTDASTYLTGDVIRFKSVTGATQLNGMDFTITNLSGVTFSLPFMATIVAGTTGAFYKVKYPEVFYPGVRYITSITQAAQAVIEMSVAHGYAVGDKVKLKVPAEFGMIEANDKIVEVLAVTTTDVTNTITVDLNTTTYTAFAFPLTGVTLTSYAQVIPLSGPVVNNSFRGFELKAGAAAGAGAAGADGDEIHWIAGTVDCNPFTD